MARPFSYYRYGEKDVPEDEWNTGLSIDDPNHHWNRNGVFETGLFINHETIRRNIENNRMRNIPRHRIKKKSDFLQNFRHIVFCFVSMLLLITFCFFVYKANTVKSSSNTHVVEQKVKASPHVNDNRYGDTKDRY